MGLDQTWYIKNRNEDGLEDDDYSDEVLGYHRKFNALQGFMSELADSRGIEDANCHPLTITLEDLDELDKRIAEGNLTPVTGFFFGAQEVREEDLEKLANIMEVARLTLAEGKEVLYVPWW